MHASEKSVHGGLARTTSTAGRSSTASSHCEHANPLTGELNEFRDLGYVRCLRCRSLVWLDDIAFEAFIEADLRLRTVGQGRLHCPTCAHTFELTETSCVITGPQRAHYDCPLCPETEVVGPLPPEPADEEVLTP